LGAFLLGFLPKGGLMRIARFLWLFLLASNATISAPPHVSETLGVVRVADLPYEARQTLALIRKGGPYPYSRDGAVFANREGRLPRAPRGTYREYTVNTPDTRDRGARRIIAASGDAFWYTADHYRSFRRIIE
jgi:ribonuclease T1